MSKIFGIGLSRTGTCSLHEALKIVGLTSIHWPSTMNEINNHQASSDITVACRFKTLDKIFPHSQFILTTRSKDGWMKSVMKHYSHVAGVPHMSPGNRAFVLEADLLLYGAINPTKEQFEAAYDKHLADVMGHFKDRPKDLLVMDVTAGDGWEKLCEFLDVDNPNRTFPHANKG